MPAKAVHVRRRPFSREAGCLGAIGSQLTAAWGGCPGPEENLGWVTTGSISTEGKEVPVEDKILDRMVRET